MKKIYNDAKDKNVATVVVYADSSNDLFYDPEFTNAVPNADGLDLFLKGVVVFKENAYYKAISCSSTGVISFGL